MSILTELMPLYVLYAYVLVYVHAWEAPRLLNLGLTDSCPDPRMGLSWYFTHFVAQAPVFAKLAVSLTSDPCVWPARGQL